MNSWTKAEAIVLPLMLVLIFSISALLGYFLRNKSEKIRSIPLIVIAAVLLILEVIKQLRALILGTYSGWTIPLHFCSFFMVWFPLAQFTTGKVKQVGTACSFATSIMMTCLFYIAPRGIIGSSSEHVFASFGDFHTFVYHHLVILYLCCILALRLYKPQKSDFLWASILFSGWAILACTMAHILNVNFTNALYASNIPFMETFRINFGQVIYTLVMYLFGIGLFNLVLFVYYKIYFTVQNRKQKNQAQIQ